MTESTDPVAEPVPGDFQRGLEARLAHLIGEASQWRPGSGAHPPGLVKALDEVIEYVMAERRGGDR